MTDTFDRGLEIRREVLGDEYVDRSMSQAQGFDLEFQRFVTEFCWGAVWGRDGLDRQTRSLLNVGMLAALNRPHELRLHARGAFRNGCTLEQLQEVCLQVAAYCGVPAALDAKRVISESHTEYVAGTEESP